MTSAEPYEVVVKHYQRVWAELRKAREELATAKANVGRLEGMVDALRPLMVEFREATLPETSPPQNTPAHSDNGAINWKTMPRSKAVLTMLRETGQPMGPANLSRALKEVGREKDEPNYISSTLDFLKKRGRVRSLGEGQWVLADQEGPGDSRVGNLLEGGS